MIMPGLFILFCALPCFVFILSLSLRRLFVKRMSSNTLKGKNILITGVNGFVGSHLFDRLSKMGANVFGLSLKGFGKAIFKVNVLNYSDLGKIIKEKNIQICYHLAGESLV